MLEIDTAIEKIKAALKKTVRTWRAYVPTNIPIAVYNDEEYVFINHPDPPDVRPDNLMAATAIEINGILTATIPLAMCPDLQALIPLVYHECFHVYQASKFQFESVKNFFEILAYYPELDPKHRALCAAESQVLNEADLSPENKLAFLAQLINRRHRILGQREGILSFEKNLERKEGVASYVEQRARAEIFDVQPETVQSHFGYSRQYVVGAAIGRLLDEAVGSDRWQEMVESGKTLSACVAAFSEDRQTDLDELRLLEMEDAEKIKVSQILRQANQKVDELLESEAITLKLPNQKYVARSFNPSAVVSLGDGRLIHSNGVGIYLPNGKIEVRDGAVLEDYSRGIVVIPGCSYDFSNSELGARENHVWLDLKNAKKRNENSFELI